MRLSTETAAVLAVIAIVVSLAGCAGRSSGAGDAELSEIDAGLEAGPVLVEFGADWCSWCKVQKPVVEDLARDYPGVTVIEVDVDEDTALKDAFFVESVPQLDIIVKKTPDGGYLYVGPSGGTTGDRYRSRLVGFLEYDELKPLIEAALAAR